MIDASTYEPKSYADIYYGNNESKLRIEDILTGVLPFPAFGKCGILLYGAWGTGKTALARLLPNEIEFRKTGHELCMPEQFTSCEQGTTGPQVMSLLNGINSTFSLNHSALHYVVLDEVDNLTELAQKSLKSVMNSKSTIYVLTTNYIHKIDKGVQDRCVLVEMNAASHQQMSAHIQRVATDFFVVLNDKEIDDIVAAAKGSIREATHDAIRRAIRKSRSVGDI